MRGKECRGDGTGSYRSDCGAGIRIRIEGAGRIDDEGGLLEEADRLPRGHEAEES